MKPIVKLTTTVVVVALILSTGVVLAQGQQGKDMIPGLQNNPLSQQQRQQISQIRQNTQQQVRQIRMNQNLSQQQKQQQIQQVQSQGHEKVMDVLTPDQKAEFQNWWQQKQNCAGGVCKVNPAGSGQGPGMGSSMGAGMGAGMGQGQMGMVPGLKNHPLSQQQSQQIAQIRMDMRQQMQDVTNNQNMTRDQKWDRLQQMQRDAHQDVVDVLTPEQRQELSDWWSQHPHSQQGQQGGMGSGGMHGMQ